jgi:hypothetical protein
MKEMNNDEWWERCCMDDGKKQKRRKSIGIYSGPMIDAGRQMVLADENTGEFDIQFGCENLTQFYKNGFAEYTQVMDRDILSPQIYSLRDNKTEYGGNGFVPSGAVLGGRKITAEMPNKDLAEGLRNGELMVRTFIINKDTDEQKMNAELQKIICASIKAMNSECYETESTEQKDLRDFTLSFHKMIPDKDIDLRFINENPKDKIDAGKILNKAGLVKEYQQDYSV